MAWLHGSCLGTSKLHIYQGEESLLVALKAREQQLERQAQDLAQMRVVQLQLQVCNHKKPLAVNKDKSFQDGSCAVIKNDRPWILPIRLAAILLCLSYWKPFSLFQEKNEQLVLRAAGVSEADIESIQQDCDLRVQAAERKVYALTKERDALRKGSEKLSSASELLKEKDEIIQQVSSWICKRLIFNAQQ